MNPSQPYLSMAQNNAWANHTLYTALTPLRKEAFTARRPGFFPSLCATVNHIHAVDLYYIDALNAGQTGLAVFDRAPVEDHIALAKAQNTADRQLTDMCRNLTPQILGETRGVERRTGPTQESVPTLLLHLFQHQVIQLHLLLVFLLVLLVQLVLLVKELWITLVLLMVLLHKL